MTWTPVALIGELLAKQVLAGVRMSADHQAEAVQLRHVAPTMGLRSVVLVNMHLYRK